MLSILFFRLIPPFLLFTPTEWMSGLKTYNTLCQAITVQNLRPPVARLHLVTLQCFSLPGNPLPISPLQPLVFMPNNCDKNQTTITEIEWLFFQWIVSQVLYNWCLVHPFIIIVQSLLTFQNKEIWVYLGCECRLLTYNYYYFILHIIKYKMSHKIRPKWIWSLLHYAVFA